MSRPSHSAQPPGRVRARGSLKKHGIKNMTAPLYQHVPANSVAPRIKTLAADWQVYSFGEGATDIEYDGEYGSERVWIVSGRATIEPNDGSPSLRVVDGVVGGDDDGQSPEANAISYTRTGLLNRKDNIT